MNFRTGGSGLRTRKKRSSKFNFFLSTSLLALILVNCPSIAKGQSENKKDTNTRLNFNARLDLEYDDNVFQFTDDDESDYDDNNPGDVASGRYKNINSKSDYIAAPRLGLDFKTDSPFEGTFSAGSWLKYHFHHYNDKKDYTEGKIEFIQTVGKGSRLSLEGNFELDFYRENDLSGARDTNEIGNVTRSERIYSASIYDEYEGIIAFRYRIKKRDTGTDNWFKAASIRVQPFAGLRYRRYDNPFGNRDRNGFLSGLAFDFNFGRKVDVDLSCAYEKISCPDNAELLLVDETDTGFNQDINGDGLLKENAPYIPDVDRSRDRYLVEIEFTIDFINNWRSYAAYRLRRDSFKSNDPIDVARYHQDDTRHRIRTGVRWDFAEDWRTSLEYTYTHDNSYDGIFKQNRIMLSLRYDF